MGSGKTDVWTALVLGLVVPGVLLNCAAAVVKLPSEETIPETTALQETQPETVFLPALVRQGEKVTEEDLDTYLVGVVLAEMPASFETEALKAQAVAARTYARKAWQTGGKHGDGSVCTDGSCCQAYLAPESYLAQGGTREGLEKITNAVTQTSDLVLTYEGELIEATYFSSTGGSTESAVAVWGTDYPYLQAVDSPETGKETTVTFSSGEFQKALGQTLEGSPETWFSQVRYTQGQGVASMDIGGQTYTGTQLRSLLGLRSTDFSLTVSGDTIAITTQGYGHRVGMSQYGADAMAVTGSDFQEILAHYYPGTEVTKVEGG